MTNWLTEDLGYLDGVVNIGFIKRDDEIYLVDTGIDNSAVNKARKSVDKEVGGALVTHHHADHMGGCSKLEKLGITQIYGPDNELPFFHNPLLEPYTMFGGGYPPEELQNRHLQAREAKTTLPVSDLSIGEVIRTPGHTPDHVAYLFDDVCYTGDAAFTVDTIDKYKLLFAVNPDQAVQSVEKLMQLDFSAMVPGHGPILESRNEIMDVLKATKSHYHNMQETVLQVIGESLDYSDYVPTVLEELDIMKIVKDRGFMQYILYQVPIQGYLSNLMDKEMVEIDTSGGVPSILAI